MRGTKEERKGEGRQVWEVIGKDAPNLCQIPASTISLALTTKCHVVSTR